VTYPSYPLDERETDLHGCARCGGDHDGMTFLKLLRPVVLDGKLLATHWTLCPDTGQPTLMLYE